LTFPGIDIALNLALVVVFIGGIVRALRTGVAKLLLVGQMRRHQNPIGFWAIIFVGTLGMIWFLVRLVEDCLFLL
jgi:hypothetical protein